MEFLGILIVFVLGVVGWFWSSSLDRGRIESYIQERGGQVISINWAPFGKGWFGEKNDRIYEVVYFDSTGNEHWATCKTSLLSGVYWTEDRVVNRKPSWYDKAPHRNQPGDPLINHVTPPAEAEDLAQENVKLRDEVERLRRELDEGR